MENEFPKRKHPRLTHYDYSTNGAYFVTICTHDKRCFLSHIKSPLKPGYIPMEADDMNEYTQYGMIAAQQLTSLEARYPFLIVDRYVVMPNHIHAVLLLNSNKEESEKRNTLMDVICSYKSLTAKECRENGFFGKLFQSSFYEHIIRNIADYQRIVKYIDDNPARWYYDQLFIEE